MKGIVKWYSDSEGFGIIKSQQGQYCFSIKDFANGKPKEGKTVAFEPEGKSITFHAQQMPLAAKVKQVITIPEVIGFMLTVIFGVVGAAFSFVFGVLKILDSTNRNDRRKW